MVIKEYQIAPAVATDEIMTLFTHYTTLLVDLTLSQKQTNTGVKKAKLKREKQDKLRETLGRVNAFEAIQKKKEVENVAEPRHVDEAITRRKAENMSDILAVDKHIARRTAEPLALHEKDDKLTTSEQAFNVESENAFQLSDYFVDTKGYYPYLLFSFDQKLPPENQRTQQLLLKLFPELDISTIIGKGNRPGSNGKQYVHYARLNSIPDDRILKEINSRLKSNLTNLSNSTLQETTRSSELESQNRKLENRLQNAKNFFRNQRSKIENLEATIDLLESSSARKSSTNRKLIQDATKEISDRLKQEQAKATKHRSQIRELKTRLQHAQDEQSIRKSLELDNSSPHETIQNLSQLLKDSEQREIDANRKASKIQLKLNNALQTLKSSDSRGNENSSDKIQGLEDEINSLKKKNDNLKNEIKELEDLFENTDTQQDEPEPIYQDTSKEIITRTLGKNVTLIGKTTEFITSQEFNDVALEKVYRYIFRIKDGGSSRNDNLKNRKKVKGTDNFWECYIERDYRLYWKKNAGKYHILIGAKSHQTADMKTLRQHD